MTVEQRLQIERNIWLTTVRPDGRPHIVPVWFVHVRTLFWVGTGAASVKTRNVLANPAVSVALEDGNRPVVVEGTAQVYFHERPDDVAGAFANKYDWDITVSEDPDVGSVVLWQIKPTKWLFGRPEEAT